MYGAGRPAIRIARGEQQFWRVVNAGADTYLDLQVDNTMMQIIALDGVPLASGVGTPASMTVTHWVLPPGAAGAAALVARMSPKAQRFRFLSATHIRSVTIVATRTIYY